MEQKSRYEEDNEDVQPTPSYQSGKSNGDKKSIRRSFWLILIGLVGGALIALLLVAIGFLIGRQEGMFGAKSLDKQRQTIVQEGDVIENVSKEVGQSVVSIVTEQTVNSTNPLFGATSRKSQAAGTGLIIDSSGLILTNKHVVPSGTSNIQIVTSDGTTYNNVQILGRDPLNDLAILKVNNPKNFIAATLGDSDSVRTGEKVIAIGNALGQFQNTVTSGIISGMGRPVNAGNETGTVSEQLSNLFQTDAAINPGNSGGPLVDFNGKVIGINTAVAQDAQNIGFAIPINEAKGIIASVKNTGKISRPYLGVHYISLTPDVAKELQLSITSGAYVSKQPDSIVNGSPADKAGLKPGDIITKVDGKQIGKTTSLSSVISRFKVGDTVTLEIVRGNKHLQISVELAEAPTDIQ